MYEDGKRYDLTDTYFVDENGKKYNPTNTDVNRFEERITYRVKPTKGDEAGETIRFTVLYIIYDKDNNECVYAIRQGYAYTGGGKIDTDMSKFLFEGEQKTTTYLYLKDENDKRYNLRNTILKTGNTCRFTPKKGKKIVCTVLHVTPQPNGDKHVYAERK